MIAVIPARGGSKGVPRKNIKELMGFPLIVYSIDIAKKVFGEVYVSTDDDDIASISYKYGAKIIDRPKEEASDTATDYDWLKHAFSVINKETIAIFRPTTPLRCAKTVIEAIDHFRNHPGCTSLRSAHEAPETPYKWFELEYDKTYWKKNPLADLPRQALPKIYIPNGYIDIVRKETIDKGEAFGEKILSFITEPIVEIDTQSEFDYLEFTMRRENEQRTGMAPLSFFGFI